MRGNSPADALPARAAAAAETDTHILFETGPWPKRSESPAVASVLHHHETGGSEKKLKSDVGAELPPGARADERQQELRDEQHELRDVDEQTAVRGGAAVGGAPRALRALGRGIS